MNGLMLQGFEWYLPEDAKHFNRIKDNLDYLKKFGFSSIWLPPVTKATGQNDVGYGVYDLYDLGEFDQKGSVATKYGTKDELIDLINTAHEKGVRIYADFVLNHKAGADETEVFKAVKVNPDNRNEEISEAHDIEAWTKFTFPGRKDKYSDFKWSFQHFNGVDFDQKTGENGIYKILWEDRDWNWAVSNEKGNYDYLMFANIDHFNPDVKKELFKWAKWFIEETNIDGIRYDALKHIDRNFINDLTKYILTEINDEFYFVGEYWENNQGNLIEYIDGTSSNIDLFDVTFHYKLFEASTQGENFDLRTLFENSIESQRRLNSVTFVDNHDSQLGQSLSSWVEDWFRQIAYSLILLTEDGYPCVFWGDLFGIGDGSDYAGMKDRLEPLLELRRDLAYGEIKSYLQGPNEIGFVRYGDETHPGRLAVAISNHDAATIRMFVGEDQKGKVYKDKLGNNDSEITIDDGGYGDFFVSAGSVSCWIEM